ncbi:MAG: phosphoadenosine phosphosulfate reductase family protein [Clostridia bacterium]|jgi:3'-phosphoadenosine 5'-phosphosulfate sulfotransferase (PAPS reductase)/FAD synthetase|nr:phosphoadenosine phosphosulfate reductase family protein [Clostridia bacterium]
MDMNELKLMQNYPLSIKISKTQFRIREFYEYFNGEVYVAFSGGNDSLVMLHIIRSMYPDVKAVFVDTGVEFPEVRKFVKTFDNVIFLKPQKNFSQIITDYGYPIISKDVSNSIRLARKNIIEGKDTYRVRQFDGSQKGSRFDKSKWKFLLDAPFKISEQCCDELKKKPFKKFEKETGLKGYIGVLASEGGVRLQGYLKTGCNNYRFGNSKPLGFWTHQDILQYIKIYNLNMCPVYGDLIFDEARNKLVVTGEPRTGCMGCMFGCHLEKSPNRFERMKISHPHMYNYFIEKLNFKSVLDYINIKY